MSSDGGETFQREQVEPDFSFITFGPDSWNPKDYNVDIEVHLPDGRRFAATFFTFENIKGLMRNYSQTGECDHGLYFWASDMILVEELTRPVIVKTIRSLIQTGEIFSALAELGSDSAEDE